MTNSEAASPMAASGTPMDLIGKTVRWAYPDFRPDQWFTALVIGYNEATARYTGTVVDPGTYGWNDEEELEPGQVLAHLSADLCTVIDSEPDTDDPECE